MPKYHFETSAATRVSVQYSGEDKREVDLFHGEGNRAMNLHTYDSLIAIDDTIPGEFGPDALNKLHLELPDGYEFTPHAERSTDPQEGHRADLCWVDRRFATQMLERLKKWRRDPEYRLELAAHKYGGHKYSHSHRRTQLCLSETGVEEMIREAEGWRKDRNIYVSNLTRRITRLYFQAMGMADYIISGQSGKTRKVRERKPFVIKGKGAKEVVDTFESIHDGLHRTLLRINRDIGELGLQDRVRDYWDWVDAWAQR